MFPFTPILPRRKHQGKPVVSAPNEVFVHSVEDLIDFSITKIQEPLDLIPEMPADDIYEPNDFRKRKSLTLTPKIWKRKMVMRRREKFHFKTTNLG